MSEKSVSRRALLRASTLGAGLTALAAASPLLAATNRRRPLNPRTLLEMCTGLETPQQPKGPFYPIHDQLDKNSDLTIVDGRRSRARGQIAYVMGTVQDAECAPIAGALVEIWQACESGRYNHENDPNTAPLDPDFQYFGKAITNREGRYVFKTIIPGAYPADKNWIRPPHIHFRVLKRGYLELVTQMYFSGDALNDKDLILRRLPPAERKSVVIDFQKPATREFEPDSKVGVFNIVLKRP